MAIKPGAEQFSILEQIVEDELLANYADQAMEISLRVLRFLIDSFPPHPASKSLNNLSKDCLYESGSFQSVISPR